MVIERICQMKASIRKHLYNIDRTLRKVLRIAVVPFYVLLIAAAFKTPWRAYLAIACAVVGFVCALLVVWRIFLSPFVKSEEEEIGSRLFERPLMEYIYLPEGN